MDSICTFIHVGNLISDVKPFHLIYKIMSLKKEFLESKPVCKVTFKLSKEISSIADQVHLAGDFNDWSISTIPMKKLKSGEYSVTVDLATGCEYEYKYILDNSQWVNDTEADKYVKNIFQGENSVVVV